MNVIKDSRAILLSIGACCAVGACTSQPTVPQTWEGLVLEPSHLFTAVYVLPDVEFPRYRSVLIDAVEVEFDDAWDADEAAKNLASEFTPEALDSMEIEMEAEFRRIFAAELRNGGYRLVDVPGADTVRLSPSLTDIYINEPVDISRGSPGTYMVRAARMTLVMDLRDGLTGQRLARVVDQQAGARTGFPELSDSVARTPEFRAAVAGWAVQLRDGLDSLEVRP